MPHKMYRLPVASWPPCDQALWRQALAPAGLFDAAGPATAWSAASRAKTEHGYGHWLRWLLDQGLLDADQPPHARATPERAEAYLRSLMPDYASHSVVNRAQELFDAMRALVPQQDWAWLRHRVAALAAHAHPVTDKRPRLRTAGELQALGRRLMAEAEALPPSDPDRALRYRDGLMIALLAYRALRVRTFYRISLGRH